MADSPWAARGPDGKDTPPPKLAPIRTVPQRVAGDLGRRDLMYLPPLQGPARQPRPGSVSVPSRRPQMVADAKAAAEVLKGSLTKPGGRKGG